MARFCVRTAGAVNLAMEAVSGYLIMTSILGKPIWCIRAWKNRMILRKSIRVICVAGWARWAMGGKTPMEPMSTRQRYRRRCMEPDFMLQESILPMKSMWPGIWNIIKVFRNAS